MLHRSEGKPSAKRKRPQQDAHSGWGFRVRLGAPRDRRRSRSVPGSPTLRLRRWPLLGGGVVQGEMEGTELRADGELAGGREVEEGDPWVSGLLAYRWYKWG